MSFIGSINAETRKWLGNNGKVLDGRLIYVGCSGNFTVEQILTLYAPKAKLQSNDISIYSGVLGAFLTNQPFRLQVQEDNFLWLEPFLTDPLWKAAALLVLLEALKYEKADNLFKMRHWQHYLGHFEEYHRATREKLLDRQKKTRIEAYTSQDIFDLLEEMPPEAVIIAFLPTYAGGYEKMFRRLEEIFDWDHPTYQMIDEERKRRILLKMTERDFLYLDDREWKGLPMVATVRKARMKPVYVYSNLDALQLGVMRQQRHTDFVPIPRLSDGDEITAKSKLTIIPTTNRVVNYFRDVYLSKEVGVPSDGIAPFIAAVDGKAFGFIIYSRMQGRGDLYLLTDFVVDCIRYQRLAKLLVLVTQTQELRRLLEEKLLQEVPYCSTMVFTDKPILMKYRGIYKLARREEGKLVYQTQMGILKLKKVIPLWLKRYEKP